MALDVSLNKLKENCVPVHKELMWVLEAKWNLLVIFGQLPLLYKNKHCGRMTVFSCHIHSW
jgi:hypothetical protein